MTKVKEKLENYLSELNEIIRNYEKINKGIKSLEKEEKNMIKTISYISTINKNKKEMNNFFAELIKSLNISFDEEKNNIKFDEYYINGIQIPKDIEFNNIGSYHFKVLWKIDDINIDNIDNNNINYRVEIKKDAKFIKEYEGNQNNCLIENLNKNTEYEIRICSVYKDLIGFWSKIEKVKTKDLDSIILNETNKEDEYLKKIYEWSGYDNMELIYRGSRDGSTAKDFHNKCDNKSPTLCLYKNHKGNIFGGFTTIPWSSPKDEIYLSDKYSFIFTLTNIYDIEPTKFPNKDINKSVRHNCNEGPCFGGGADIAVFSDFKKQNFGTAFPRTYQDILGKGNSIFTGEINTSFPLEEIEIFKLFK